ncbi:agmatine deiminase family protein [Intrasporangium calvum]|uniref:Agmatine deiminase family protein n=1 Tax=Intrasporangium calvum TaxID=53358 RepID=A0ABT5GJC0_9MICO|nr:agmatine deiminase family protein [Intrasporangium calvum]MDC5698252.1 agmatine deiminase family protein [Intrasporangium calvum]
MPSEAAPHECTWMAWPSQGYTLGDTAEEVARARLTWAAVANAVIEFEPVRMVVVPEDLAVARAHLHPDVELLTASLDDAWMRDIGPTFVVGEGGQLGAVDWVFNGWGAQAWASWEHDARIGAFVAGQTPAELIPSTLVNEGGGIHVDGLGTVLLTETVQLDPGRNPGLTRADVEAELARTIGATHAIWLPRGLTRDYDEFGTRGHVDIVATIPSPGVLLLHEQEDPSHPDHVVSKELRDLLSEARDARGERFEVVGVPAPRTLADAEGPVDWSYLNHLVVNDAVIACTFDDPQDARALGMLADAYPGRRIVGVDARPLFDRGGGIHCITQQQPAL